MWFHYEPKNYMQLKCPTPVKKFMRKEYVEENALLEAGKLENEEQFNLPNAMKRLRACLRCKIILSTQQFFREGCPNCSGDYVGDRQAVEQSTTRNFSGTAAIIDPNRSWVGRNIKVDGLLPGVYAVAVQGGYAGDGVGDYEIE
jgi:transcription elongation factor SPT4